MKFLAEELGQLDGDEDAAEEEDHGVSDGREEDAEFAGKEERLDELKGLDGRRIDAPELEILLLEGRALVGGPSADVAGFWAKEEVEEELDAIDLVRDVR